MDRPQLLQSIRLLWIGLEQRSLVDLRPRLMLPKLRAPHQSLELQLLKFVVLRPSQGLQRISPLVTPEREKGVGGLIG